MLAQEVDYVIGVDTHKESHSAAVVNATGGVIVGLEASACGSGYRTLLRHANSHAAGRRIWAVEGTGSYGSGHAASLHAHGERVIEIERPRRPGRTKGKSDQLDAIRAAREALADDKLATPRDRGQREALRILLTTREGAMRARTAALCQLHALVVGAPDEIRGRLRRLRTEELVRRCLVYAPAASRTPSSRPRFRLCNRWRVGLMHVASRQSPTKATSSTWSTCSRHGSRRSPASVRFARARS
jgi:transposase